MGDIPSSSALRVSPALVRVAFPAALLCAGIRSDSMGEQARLDRRTGRARPLHVHSLVAFLEARVQGFGTPCASSLPDPGQAVGSARPEAEIFCS